MAQKIVLRETARMALWQLGCGCLLLGSFAALGQFEVEILWSILGSSGLMISNYLLLAVSLSMTRDQKAVRLSSLLRLLGLGAALVIAIRLGAHVTALLLPMLLSRPVLMLAAFFQ